MKRLTLLSLFVLIVAACGSQPTNAPTIVDEKYEPTDEELYAACAELKGIGQYVIGKSTFSSVTKDREYRAQNSYENERRSTFGLGHWGPDYWRSHAIGGVKVKESEQARYIETETRGKIKQLHNSFSFKVGELEFDPFDLAFLNDTLVAIWFYPKDEETVINHYLEKYGNGRGKKYHYDFVSKNIKGEIISVEKLDEKHVWENETVSLEFVNFKDWRSAPNEKTHLNYKHTLLMYNKSRYPVFEQLLKEQATKFEELKKQETEGTLNTL